MIIEESFLVQKWHRWMNGLIGFYLVLGCLISLTLLSLYFFSERREEVLPQMTLFKAKESPVLSFLPEEEESVWVPSPSIHNKILFLEYNNRPDVDKSHQSILLGFEGKGEKRAVLSGEKVYFQSLDDKAYEFSETPTPFSIIPRLSGQNRLEVTFQVEHLGENGEVIYEDTNVNFLEKKATGGISEEIILLLKGLEKIHVYGPDQLIDLYGGEAFKSIKGRYRLAFCDREGEPLFVGVGSMLSYEEGDWVARQDETRGKPLLFLKSIDRQKCEFLLWGRDGLSSHPFSISLDKGPVSLKAHELFSHLHHRSESSATCLLQNRNVIVRSGDWLIKTKGGWRHLHSAKDIKDCLKYALKGELFIFDGIEKREGAHIFTGHLFDEKRTSVQKVELPLLEKRQNLLKSKKNAPSRKEIGK